MQLGNKSKLAAAASALLGASFAGTSYAQGAQWKHTVSAFHYTESDDRVDDSAIQIQGTRTTPDEKIFNYSIGVDTLSGASPSGRVAFDGSGTLTLTELEDMRYSASFGYSQRVGNSLTLRAGLSASTEDDYLHTGINFGISKELNQKNTTLSLGVALSADSIDAVFGNRKPGFPFASAQTIGEQDKDVTDVVLGWTQILSKNMLAQINLSFSKNSGYLNDPYKLVSIVDGDGKPVTNIVESRPDDRQGGSLYTALNVKNRLGVFKPSYRYYNDDFGIDSHTLELRQNYMSSKGGEFEPYIRIYSQGKADFYRAQIPSTELIPANLSSDYRLSDFDALTLGFIYRWKGNKDVQYRIGADYYKQSPKTPADQLAGQSDLNPGIEAILVRFGFSF